jgi:hypothetical protein
MFLFDAEGDVAGRYVQLEVVLASAPASYPLLSISVNLQYSSPNLLLFFKSAHEGNIFSH